MAEEDVMLVAIRMDAKGAIKDTAVLDNKFKSLGKTFKNSKKPMDNITASQNKLNKAVKDGQKSTTKDTISSIGKLQALEGLTSAINQGISAQYKRIDADLAAGKITAEEAEAKRKQVKQQEKWTGLMETGIAIARLHTVVMMVYNSVLANTTTGTNTATLSTKAFNAALKANPVVLIISSIVILIAYMAAVEKIFGKTTVTIDAVTDSFKRLREMWSSLLELANPFDNIIESDTAKRLGSMMGG